MSKSKTQKHGIDVTLYFIPLLASFNRSKEGLRAGSKNERWSCKKALPDIVSKRKLQVKPCSDTIQFLGWWPQHKNTRKKETKWMILE
jgi:hypothetical protein